MSSKLIEVGEEELARGPSPAAAASGRLTARQLGEQLARCAAALDEGIAKGDLTTFYDTFRASDLPFLPNAHTDRPQGLFQACFEVLLRFGGITPAVGLAVENHYYVTAALATFPTRHNPELDRRRRKLLCSVVEGRLLVANTSSRIHTDKVGTLGAVARRDGDGFRVSGSAAYMSLASQSDLVFFLATFENQGPAVFVAPLRDNPEIEIGPLLFANAMADSDTRRVTFRDLYLAGDDVVMVGRSEEMAKLSAFQLAWHQALLTVPFLGAAARALEAARQFLRQVQAPNGKPLAELDGMIVDVGRLAIRYRTACCTAHRAGEALAALARARRPKLARFADAFELACAAKQAGTKCAEDIVTEVRRIIGGRSLAGGHPLERLSQEVMFGPIGGEVNAFIERRYGRLLLGEDEFPCHRW